MKTRGIALLSIALGWASFWANRHVMYPDGISYLELGNAIWRDGWMAAVNGCWSPLLALLTGLAETIFRPAAFGEFRLANGINFLIYAASVVALEWLTGRYWALHGQDCVLSRRGAGLLLHTVHMTAALSVTGMNYFTPDILLMACCYLALGTMLRPGGTSNAIWFGVALGLGYLGKAAFLVTGVLLWIVAAIWWRGRAGWMRDLAISGAVFAALIALYAVPLSVQKGRLTIAENGRVNYLTHVLGVKSPAEPDARFGPPAIPVEQLPGDPATHVLPRWPGVTYPFHYDVSRFYDGWRYSISPGAHAGSIRASLRVYGGMLRKPAVASLILLALLLAAAAGLRRFHPVSWLWLPVLGSAAVFALVHVEPRYTAPLFIPGCLTVLAALRMASRDHRRNLGFAVAGVAVVCSLIVLRAAAGPNLFRDHHPDAAFARELARAGARAGDPVSVIGLGYNRGWARVGRYWIATETPDRTAYEQASNEARQALAAQLRQRGVRALVIPGKTAPPDPGWIQVPGTGWSFRMLD